MKGLEPPRLSALDPKSSAATNYATSATMFPKKQVRKDKYFFYWQYILLKKYNISFFTPNILCFICVSLYLDKPTTPCKNAKVYIIVYSINIQIIILIYCF